eukprot:120688_1
MTHFFQRKLQSFHTQEKSVTYVPLKMSCPACKNKDINQWYHATDNKEMSISQYAYVKCNRYHGDDFVEWLWDCGNHTKAKKYQEAKKNDAARALRSVLSLLTSPEIELDDGDALGWFDTLTSAVTKQFREKKKK